MKLFIVSFLKRLFYSLRRLLGRFIILDANDSETIFFKAGSIVAADMIEGDYLEFGVFKGESFARAYHSIKKAFNYLSVPSVHNSQQDCDDRNKLWKKMRFIAFDSFQGLPKPSGVDALSKYFIEGKYANPKENFIQNIKSMGVPLEQVEIVAGWFNETLKESTIEKHNLKRASIIHIDSDFYESAKLVLNFIKPLLSNGTIIIFDDWFTFKGNPDLGEQKALGEWLKENSSWIATEYQKEGPWRNSFIINKKVE